MHAKAKDFRIRLMPICAVSVQGADGDLPCQSIAIYSMHYSTLTRASNVHVGRCVSHLGDGIETCKPGVKDYGSISAILYMIGLNVKKIRKMTKLEKKSRVFVGC